MKLGDLVNCGKLFHPIGPHPLQADCFNPRSPPISLTDRVDHLTAAADDLRGRLEKLTLEQAAKDQENTRLIAALDGLFDACDCGSGVKPTCFGAKEGAGGFGCPECCAHEQNENDDDGWCVPLRSAPTSDNGTTRQPPEAP